MKSCSRVQIYQGMIRYMLETTNYSLKSIAYLSKTSFKNIRTIHAYGELPTHFDSEMELVNLFQIILEINIKQQKPPFYFYKESGYENHQY